MINKLNEYTDVSFTSISGEDITPGDFYDSDTALSK